MVWKQGMAAVSSGFTGKFPGDNDFAVTYVEFSGDGR